MNFLSLKKSLTKTNLYYTGGALAILITAIIVGVIYSTQSQENAKASLILADADGIVSQLKVQNSQIEQLTRDYFSILPKNYSRIVNQNFRVNDLTRYFDTLEQQYKTNGQFELNSLNYSTSELEQDYIDASINLNTSKDNLISFLEFIEKSGFGSEEIPYLLELRSITFTVPVEEVLQVESDNSAAPQPITQEELNQVLNPVNAPTDEFANLSYSVVLQLRIYNFKPATVTLSSEDLNAQNLNSSQ